MLTAVSGTATHLLRRIVTAIVGGLLMLIGVVLLVLPGPGFVVVAAGLAVLAREFEWAARPLNYAKKRAQDGLAIVGRHNGFAAIDALAGIALAAAGILDIVVGLPVLEIVGDVFLIASGGFLVGTVFYARRSTRQTA